MMTDVTQQPNAQQNGRALHQPYSNAPDLGSPSATLPHRLDVAVIPSEDPTDALQQADAPIDTAEAADASTESAAPAGVEVAGEPAATVVPPPPSINVSHRFLRGLLPNRDPKSYLLSPSNLLTRRAEDFRHLRTRLKLALGDSGIVLVTSARHGEGRSITALNLGLAFAQEYERVVYVEADFRRPALHTFFELDQGRGLSPLLRRPEPIGQDLGDEVFPTDVPGFFLLPAGVRAGSPELIESPRMAQVVAQLRVEADWAIIDSPPMLTYAETLAIAKLVDGVVVVALDGRSHDDDVQRLSGQLSTVDAHVLAAAYLHRA